MRELKLSRDTFDNERKFRVAGVSGDVSLQKDYIKEGDGILYGMQHGTLLKATYTPEDLAHLERMNTENPIQKDEVVMIDGKQYVAKIKGDYSDCVIFELVEGEAK